MDDGSGVASHVLRSGSVYLRELGNVDGVAFWTFSLIS